MTNDRTTHYQSDALNRYPEREFPAAVDVRGLAPANVGVLVNSALTIRTDEAFYAEALFDNSQSAIAAEVVVKALDPGPPEQLAQESRSVNIAQSPEAYQYDLDGNLIQDGLWTYTWDGQNRLTAMETRSYLAPAILRQRLTFTYDSQSRRIGKTVEQWNGTIWEPTSDLRYLYDGWNLIATFTHNSSFILHNSYLWGIDLSGSMQGAGGVGGLLLASTDHGDHAPGFDANGNIIAWVDLSDGNMSGTAEYSPFGEVLTQSGVAREISFGFSTKYTDNETGLLYYGYRFLNPETGRWLNRDPIEEQGGLNLYGFVGNDGVNQIDLLGLTDGSINIWVCRRPLDLLLLNRGTWGIISHSFLSTVNLDGVVVNIGDDPPTDQSNTFSWDKRDEPAGTETFPNNFTYTITCRQVERKIEHGSKEDCCVRAPRRRRRAAYIKCCEKESDAITSCLASQIYDPSACSSGSYQWNVNNCHQNVNRILDNCCAK